MTATAAAAARPELTDLDEATRVRVAELVTVRGGRCAAYEGAEFAVGSALYLGWLFLDEADDAYLVALTCRNPSCPQPRTAIRLCYNEFCDQPGSSGRARSNRSTSSVTPRNSSQTAAKRHSASSSSRPRSW